MDKEEIRKILKSKKVDLIQEINYNNKKYLKTIKIFKNKPQYIYYEIANNDIVEVRDIRLIEYLKSQYEIQSKNIIY